MEVDERRPTSRCEGSGLRSGDDLLEKENEFAVSSSKRNERLWEPQKALSEKENHALRGPEEPRKTESEKKTEERKRRRAELIAAKCRGKGSPKMEHFDSINFFKIDRSKDMSEWFGTKFDAQVKAKKKSPTSTLGSGRSGFKNLEQLKLQMSKNIEKRTLQGLQKRRQLYKDDNPDAEDTEDNEEVQLHSFPTEGASHSISKNLVSARLSKPTDSDDDSDYQESEESFGSGEDSDNPSDVEDEKEDTGKLIVDEKSGNSRSSAGEEDDEEIIVRKKDNQRINKIIISDDEEEEDSEKDGTTGGERANENQTTADNYYKGANIMKEDDHVFKSPELLNRSWNLASFSQLHVEDDSNEEKAANELGLGANEIVDPDELEMALSGAFATPAPAIAILNKVNPPGGGKPVLVETKENDVTKGVSKSAHGVSEAVNFANVDFTSETLAEKSRKTPKLKFDPDDSDSDDDIDLEVSNNRTCKGNIFFDEEARDGFQSEAEEAVEEAANRIGDDSNDELAEYKRSVYTKSNFYDDEASLSGDDVGSDSDNDGNDNDEYEVEEGDADDVPDDDELRADLQKQFIKHQQDEEDKRLLYLQDKFVADGDMNSTTDRNFRFKLREEEDAKLITEDEMKVHNADECEDDEEYENEVEESQKRAEKAAWLLMKQDETLTTNAVFGFDELEGSSSMLQAGALALKKKVAHSELVSKTYSGGNRDSMLQNSDSLSLMMKDSSSSTIASHSLFTVMPTVGRSTKRPLKSSTENENSAKRNHSTNIFEKFDV